MFTNFRFLFLLTSILIFYFLFFIVQFFSTYHQQRVVFCDVGQGDAVLVIDRDFQMLIDGGPDHSVLYCLTRHMPLFDDTIETLVLTHPDSDHFAGLISVFRHYRVKKISINNIAKTTPDFLAFYTALSDEVELENMLIIQPNFADSFCETEFVCWQVISNFTPILPFSIFQNRTDFTTLSDIVSEFIPTNYDYNSGSVVLNLTFIDKKFLLTGDAERAQELALIRGGLLTEIDVLKVGHHGSKTSSSAEFISLLQPETAIISCGRDNSFGHPHQIILDTLNNYNISIYRTDLLGEISYSFDRQRGWEWNFFN